MFKVISIKHQVVLAVGLWVALSLVGWSAPFEKTISFCQPDGTVISLWGKGDEFHAVFETLDGYTVVFNPATKAYEYADLSADGNDLVTTGLRVGRETPTGTSLAKHLRVSRKSARAKARQRYLRWEEGLQVQRRWNELKTFRRNLDRQAAGEPVLLAPPSFTTTGTKVGLCLLIDFDDDPATIPQAEVVQFCHGDSYTGYGNNGSVKKYFQDNSGGLLTYSNVVTVYLRIPNSLHPKSWYNDTSKDCGSQGNLLIRDAIAILTNLPNYATAILPAFDNLTVDANGNVLACNVFYAGGNGGVWSYGLWPHSWSLYEVGAQSLGPGGKKVYDYQITDMGSSLELGTFCHENGHMLCGFPDIYDYDYDSIGGAGMFCLMNSGGHGVNPVQVNAYLKRAAGWATTLALSSTSSLTATLTSSAGPAFNRFYRYAKPGSSTEYFLLENRQRIGRDANLPAAGIAVWHVDELGDRDNQSLVFNGNHANYELTLVQADNLWHFQKDVNSGDKNDLFYLGNTAAAYSNRFSDSSSPHARWWDGTASSIHFWNFSTSSTVMTFQVEADSRPSFLHAVGVSTSRIDLAWGLNGSNDNVLVAWNSSPVFGQPSGSYQAGQSIAGGGTVLYVGGSTQTFHAGLSASTPYYYKAWSVLNGPAYSEGVAAGATTAFQVPMSENFEDAGAMPVGWNQEIVSGSASWTFQKGNGDTHPYTAYGGLYNALLKTSSYAENKTRLVMPMLDFGSASGDAILTFWHYMEVWGPDQDELRIFYKTARNAPWVQLASYTSSVKPWTKRTVTLPNPGREYFVAFEGNAIWGYGVCIDDVSVTLSNGPATAPSIVAQPVGFTSVYGVLTSLVVVAQGSPPLSYQWKQNGLNRSGATNATLAFAPLIRSDAGTYQVVVSNAVGSVTSSLVSVSVWRADQTINFPAIPDQDQTNRVGLAASASSGLPVTFAVQRGPAVLVGGTNLSFTGTGLVAVVASQAGDTNWKAAPAVTNLFAVTGSRHPALVALADLAQTYNGTARPVSATTIPEGLSVVFTYNGQAGAPTNAGTYAVTGTVVDAVYQGSATGALVVARASQTINFPVIPDQRIRDVVGLAATASSGLPVAFTVVRGPAVIAGGTNLTCNGEGEVLVAATQDGNGNWKAAPTVTNRFQVSRVTVVNDFDGDGRSDLAVYNASSMDWKLWFGPGSGRTNRFGLSSSVPVPADYDGDGVLDYAVFKRSAAQWSILQSSDNQTVHVVLGTAKKSVPVPGDYDGDLQADLAVYTITNGPAVWLIRRSSDPAVPLQVQFGVAGWVPAPADYNGDGVTEMAVFNPTNGDWSVLLPNDQAPGGIEVLTYNFGVAKARRPVPSDYDGDGQVDLAVHKTSTGQWFIRQSGSGGAILVLTESFSTSGRSVPADYDGDGLADLAVYRPSTGVWYIRRSSDGSLVIQKWGGSAWQPALLNPLLHLLFGL